MTESEIISDVEELQGNKIEVILSPEEEKNLRDFLFENYFLTITKFPLSTITSLTRKDTPRMFYLPANPVKEINGIEEELLLVNLGVPQKLLNLPRFIDDYARVPGTNVDVCSAESEIFPPGKNMGYFDYYNSKANQKITPELVQAVCDHSINIPSDMTKIIEYFEFLKREVDRLMSIGNYTYEEAQNKIKERIEIVIELVDENDLKKWLPFYVDEQENYKSEEGQRVWQNLQNWSSTLDQTRKFQEVFLTRAVSEAEHLHFGQQILGLIGQMQSIVSRKPIQAHKNQVKEFAQKIASKRQTRPSKIPKIDSRKYKLRKHELNHVHNIITRKIDSILAIHEIQITDENRNKLIAKIKALVKKNALSLKHDQSKSLEISHDIAFFILSDSGLPDGSKSLLYNELVFQLDEILQKLENKITDFKILKHNDEKGKFDNAVDQVSIFLSDIIDGSKVANTPDSEEQLEKTLESLLHAFVIQALDFFQSVNARLSLTDIPHYDFNESDDQFDVLFVNPEYPPIINLIRKGKHYSNFEVLGYNNKSNKIFLEELYTKADRLRKDKTITVEEYRKIRCQLLLTTKIITLIGDAILNLRSIKMPKERTLSRIILEARAMSGRNKALFTPYLIPQAFTRKNSQDMQIALATSYWLGLDYYIKYATADPGIRNLHFLEYPNLKQWEKAREKRRKLNDIFSRTPANIDASNMPIDREISNRKSDVFYVYGENELPEFLICEIETIKYSLANQVVVNQLSADQVQSLEKSKRIVIRDTSTQFLPLEESLPIPFYSHVRPISVQIFSENNVIFTTDFDDSRQIMRNNHGQWFINLPDSIKNVRISAIEFSYADLRSSEHSESITFNQDKAISRLLELIQILASQAPILSTMLGEAIINYNNSLLIDLDLIDTAILSACFYDTSFSTGVTISLDGFLNDINRLIDPESGLIQVQCSTVALIKAYIFNHILQDEQDIQITYREGYLDKQNKNTAIFNRGMGHACVTINQNGNEMHFLETPDLVNLETPTEHSKPIDFNNLTEQISRVLEQAENNNNSSSRNEKEDENEELTQADNSAKKVLSILNKTANNSAQANENKKSDLHSDQNPNMTTTNNQEVLATESLKADIRAKLEKRKKIHIDVKKNKIIEIKQKISIIRDKCILELRNSESVKSKKMSTHAKFMTDRTTPIRMFFRLFKEIEDAENLREVAELIVTYENYLQSVMDKFSTSPHFYTEVSEENINNLKKHPEIYQLLVTNIEQMRQLI